jgi:mono/diheme cytochrome c family protein
LRYVPLMSLLLAAPATASDPALDFFETKVRPVFAERCYPCHAATAKSVKGGLRLDDRDAFKKGGDSGPVFDPKNPKASLLLKSVRHDESAERMPPTGPKLTDTQIADLEKWIVAGAPMPAAVAKKPNAGPHWAFQPVAPYDAKLTVDSLVRAKAVSVGLTPAPRADKRTLLRRVSVDLTGLPPTYDEYKAFEADTDSDAYRKAVERLLASPRYGERWGRHWLDVARYSDTKDGVLQYGEDRLRPFAFTYRDYVIRAFNEDVPYDRFVKEQLAADAVSKDPKALAAMGFLTLGRLFDNNLHDVIDDRIDTVTRGLLGLTVSCARCHDHKFDPIPTADYYSIYAVFAACEMPTELPPLDPMAKGPAEYEKQYAATVAGIRQMHEQQYAFLLNKYRSKTGEYLVRVATTTPDPIETADFFFSFAPEELRPPLVNRWRKYLAARAVPGDPIFGPWAELMGVPESEISARVGTVAVRYPNANPLVIRELLAGPVKSKEDVATAYGRAFKVTHDRLTVLPPSPLDPAHRELAALFDGPDGPGFFPKSLARRFMSRAEADNFGGRIQQLDKLAVKEANAPARAMAMADLSEIKPQPIFVRGNPSRPGPLVPRQFLECLSGPERKPFTNGSGRRDLAESIAAPTNPLTARVFVNRVWMHHFGEPLVATPSDFGPRTAKPLQHELLDYLAAAFIAEGWSVKSLHRRIVLSDTYCQSSLDRPDVRTKDPENQYWCRTNRRRLDWESFRDGLLFASGRLDLTAGGRAVDVANDPANRRRTVYGVVDRQSVPGVFRAFDFATPDQSVERRPQTTVPQQALFALNSPFVLTQATSLAERPDVRFATDPRAKVRALYKAALGRDGTDLEVNRGTKFLAEVPDAVAQLAQVLLLTNEFSFVD